MTKLVRIQQLKLIFCCSKYSSRTVSFLLCLFNWIKSKMNDDDDDDVDDDQENNQTFDD